LKYFGDARMPSQCPILTITTAAACTTTTTTTTTAAAAAAAVSTIAAVAVCRPSPHGSVPCVHI